MRSAALVALFFVAVGTGCAGNRLPTADVIAAQAADRAPVVYASRSAPVERYVVPAPRYRGPVPPPPPPPAISRRRAPAVASAVLPAPPAPRYPAVRAAAIPAPPYPGTVARRASAPIRTTSLRAPRPTRVTVARSAAPRPSVRPRYTGAVSRYGGLPVVRGSKSDCFT